MNSKGQTNGLVTGLIFAIAGLVIAVLIAFVLINALTGANLLEANRVTTTVSNETGGFINATGYTLSAFNTITHTGLAITAARNGTDGAAIPASNYTLNTATGVVTNATATVYSSAQFDYSYRVKTNEELSEDAITGNFTSGIDNISGKVPTVLLVAVIVLILSVLAVLVTVWRKMSIGGGEL